MVQINCLYLSLARARPRAFKNVTVLVEYTAKKRAWMTGALFEEWIRKLNRRMRLEGRHIALLVDNCPTHPFIEMSNVELIFLPPNTTSVTQPMDAGIINTLKFHYRFILANRRLETADNDTPFYRDILDAVIALKRAWMKVTAQTIANYYMNARFKALE